MKKPDSSSGDPHGFFYYVSESPAFFRGVSCSLSKFVTSCKQYTVNPIKLETGVRPNSAGIPYTLLLRIEAIGFPTFGLLL